MHSHEVTLINELFPPGSFNTQEIILPHVGVGQITLSLEHRFLDPPRPELKLDPFHLISFFFFLANRVEISADRADTAKHRAPGVAPSPSISL